MPMSPLSVRDAPLLGPNVIPNPYVYSVWVAWTKQYFFSFCILTLLILFAFLVEMPSHLRDVGAGIGLLVFTAVVIIGEIIVPPRACTIYPVSSNSPFGPRLGTV